MAFPPEAAQVAIFAAFDHTGALSLGAAMIVVELTATAATQRAAAKKQEAMLRELEMLRAREKATPQEKAALATVLDETAISEEVRRHGRNGRLGGATAGHQRLVRVHLKAWGCSTHSGGGAQQLRSHRAG